MKLQEITTTLNNIYSTYDDFGADAKLWEKHGKVRIYIGDYFLEIRDGEAYPSVPAPRQGFYETNSKFIDRADSEKKQIMPIHVVARLVNYLLNK